MQDNKVIVFVGMPGVGKSVCVNYLKDKGLPTAYFGGITIDEVKKRSLEVTEANERFVREDIRAKEGKGAYAMRILAQAEEYFEAGQKLVVIDGLYSWTEYKIFKEALEDRAIIIAIVAPRSVRHKRLAERAERPLTEAEATSRDYAEIENLEKGGPIANADYYLANSDKVEELEASLNGLLKKLDIQL
ncbi:MAG TPA: AAA family ATPase [Candidatus Saccharimonadales bacterium]|jgi:dephospho-CoA kinase